MWEWEWGCHSGGGVVTWWGCHCWGGVSLLGWGCVSPRPAFSNFDSRAAVIIMEERTEVCIAPHLSGLWSRLAPTDHSEIKKLFVGRGFGHSAFDHTSCELAFVSCRLRHTGSSRWTSDPVQLLNQAGLRSENAGSLRHTALPLSVTGAGCSRGPREAKHCPHLKPRVAGRAPAPCRGWSTGRPQGWSGSDTPVVQPATPGPRGLRSRELTWLVQGGRRWHQT